jgi:hypothetical protein
MERDIIFKIILFCDEKRSFYWTKWQRETS